MLKRRAKDTRGIVKLLDWKHTDNAKAKKENKKYAHFYFM